MSQTLIPANPFQRIALSCSGGGYRAASYHLGAMAYLQQLHYGGEPLLEKVKMISTVSGGTITGIVYALGKAKGQDFNTIYNFLINQLKQIDLVKEGILMLNPDAHWTNTTKTKNLINAFALQYDKYLTEGAAMKDLNLKPTHLEAVVFNSTEFSNALDFRFRNSGTGYSGNYYVVVKTSDMAEARLSDMMAASSCFPGGFEPMLWPQDFIYEGSTKLLELAKSGKQTGLMDGGIYDNQGIDSILRYKKKKNEANFDLIIVSDVASPKMKAYEPSSEAEKTGFYQWTVKDLLKKTQKLNGRIGFWLFVVLVLGILIPAFSCFAGTFINGLLMGLAIAAAALLIGKAMAIGRINSAYTWVKGRITTILPAYYREKLSHLQVENLSLHRLEPLVVDRLKSVGSLLSNVFLKVVRRLNYSILFEDPNYEYRRVGNLIRQLTEDDFNDARKRERAKGKPGKEVLKNSIFTGDYQTDIGTKLKELSEEAADFGTTLWFTDQDNVGGMLDKLLLTGKATMCYNMIRYLEELIFTPDNGFIQLPKETQEAINATYEQCKADWVSFKN